MRLVALALAGVVTLGAPAKHHKHSRPGCPKTFTVPMAHRAVDVTYGGAGNVTGSDRALLRRIVRCSRDLSARPGLHRYWGAHIASWEARRYDAANPLFYATASYYEDAGATASGFHAFYGVANLTLAFGTRVLICFHGCVTGTVDDRGPYVAGRLWDLNQNVAAAVGFDGLDTVGYRVAR